MANKVTNSLPTVSFSLNGEWTLTGTDRGGNAVTVPVTVPGYAHPALEKAGLIPPMFYGKNAEECQWIETVPWIFSRRFDLPDGADPTRAVLQLDGIDTYADILCNGVKLGSTKNMFVPFSAPLSPAVRPKDNLLEVVIHPYTDFLEGKELDRMAAFRSDRVNVRRVQCTFWWDWVDRFVSAGIWREASVVFPAASRFDHIYVYTADIRPSSASLGIRMTTENAVGTGCTFRTVICDPDGKQVWERHGRVFLDEIRMQADIRDPQLWWPAGYGAQPLYTLSFELFSADGVLLETRRIETGIRTVRFETLTDLPGSAEEKRSAQLRETEKITDPDLPGESMTLLVNGRRVFARGGNWVPPCPFPGTYPAEGYEELIRLAVGANLNCLRVWGGGVYENDLFYRLCDRYGVMLLHDFMLSCANYPDNDPEFVDNFRDEVRANVLRLRNHASIILWEGNNEDNQAFAWDDPESWNISLLPAVYYPVLDALDPMREFRPSSPYGGLNNSELAVGENHGSWWWRGAENLTPVDFDMIGRFTSESPFAGYPLRSTLRRFLDEADLDPESPVLEYHIKDNAFFVECGMASIPERLRINSRVLLSTSEDRRQQMYLNAYLQYEWARMTIEGARRSDRYCSALLFWMYNDCWPALGYATVDWYRRPKSGWYSARRAFAPIAASIREQNGTLQFYCLNDGAREGLLTYRLFTADTVTGAVAVLREGEYQSRANESAVICTCDAPTGVNVIVFGELYLDGKRIDRARWYPHWLSDVKLAPARIDCAESADGRTVTLTCREGVAVGVALDGDFVADDNCFDLLPGESVTLHLQPEESFDGIEYYCYTPTEFTVVKE